MYEIKQIDELIDYRNEAVIVVAVLNKNQQMVRDKLNILGFKNVFYTINTQFRR